MELIETNLALNQRIEALRAAGKTIGFVPTLGALHDGHASLIRKSKRKSDITVCSIFVNPTQFNDPSDLKKYPRTYEADSKLLTSLETDILYMPSVKEVYPSDLDTAVHVDFGNLFTVMEGAHRPGHFDGVVQVVKRLLDIVKPDQLYMGQKDFQQFTIIQHMINELKMPVELVVCKIKREDHGLAMSSRNERLVPSIRERASIIRKTMIAVKRKIKKKPFSEIKEYATHRMTIPDFKPEYFSIVDGNNLQRVTSYEDSDYIVACTAVWAGEIRLIDNIILKHEK
ncbi:pantoate--beta-alanine ligase [Portibacter lacus]|uniref:Pantothenate synthetase n=1 Tax=Portibacter lacus TaxID=1099794 RepID=A0AA37WE38_9BACT|nr:pantoate--beta-alanine ligase [Portibacter lacus]GLR18521.1 pantothenate synthetase [Portibacter lacus]